ncbi:methyltransferase domain-containing protein [Actinoplanes sp. CA-054009]
MTAERVRAAYGSMADLYIGLFGTREQSHPDDLDLIRRHLAVRPGRVLDVGCGPGHLTDYLRSLGTDAAGIDLVPSFIDHARAAFPGGDYRLGSLRDLGADSLAGILAWFSLIHIPPAEIDDVLTGFRRAMAPGGVLVTGFFDGGDLLEPFDHKVTTAYRWPVDEFSARLRRAGFTEVERMRRPAERTQRPLAAIASRCP